MIDKKTYTKIFLKQSGQTRNPVNIQFYLKKWWYSYRKNKRTSLRLSDEGFEFLSQNLNIKNYEISFVENIEMCPSIILFLDRYLDCPYYLTTKTLNVFSEKFAFRLHMFSDDIRKFGLTKAIHEISNDHDDD